MNKRFCISVFSIFAALAMSANPIIAAPKQMPDGQIFDAEYYAVNNPDVVKVFGTSESMLYQHYVSYGKKEGRRPYAETDRSGSVLTMPDGTKFDPVYYAAQNPDVVKVFGAEPAALYQHYIAYGKKEGRLPCGQDLTYQNRPSPEKIQTTYEDRIFELTNQARIAAGRAPLKRSMIREKDAAVRAKEASQVKSHTRPNGLPWYTLDRSHMNGENIVWAPTSSSADEAFNAWMNSPGHKANILSPAFTKIGIGHFVSDGLNTGVQNFEL